jgi:hypothetical protein
MFTDLSKYEYTRSGKQAVGFYIAYVFIGMLIGVAFGGLAGSLTSGDPSEAGMFAGRITGFILCLSLGVIIAYKKSLFSSFKVLVLIVIAAILATFAGTLGGLIPIAYLTTVPNENT